MLSNRWESLTIRNAKESCSICQHALECHPGRIVRTAVPRRLVRSAPRSTEQNRPLRCRSTGLVLAPSCGLSDGARPKHESHPVVVELVPDTGFTGDTVTGPQP